MTSIEVFELEPMLDTPGFACLSFADSQSLTGTVSRICDFSPKNPQTRAWTVQRLSEVWDCPRVNTRLPKQVNDYPTIDWIVPAFSERAVNALARQLDENGELLALKSSAGSYVACNVTTVADVLDREHSTIEWPIIYKVRKQTPIVANRIVRYEFFSEKLENLSLFRIPEDVSGYYVTSKFVNLVMKHELVGFHFRKVWPNVGDPQANRGIVEMEKRSGLR